MESGIRITELTAGQEDVLREVAKDWAAVDRATGPGDRAAAEDGVRAAYRACGLAPPPFIVWLGSPWAGLIGQAMLPGLIASVLGDRPARVRARFRRRLRRELVPGRHWILRPEVYDRARAQVSEAVDARVMELLREPRAAPDGWRFVVHSHVQDQVNAQHLGVLSSWTDSEGYIRSARYDLDVVAAVQAELLAQVAEQAGVSPVPEGVPARLPVRWWRGRALSGLGVAPYMWADAMERLGVMGMDDLHGEQQVARHAGYWWAFRDYAVLTPRPDVFRRDAQGRLHCAEGPAAVWPDGWAIHSWHGRRVPATLIAGSWDTARILAESNVEVRRCAIERMGWPEFIVAAGLRQVGRREPDPGNPGQWLSLYELPHERGRVRVLLCTNASVERDGTRRQYGLTVPADTPDATTAAAGLLGLTREQYLTIARAT
ncbi:DUF6745 domain-containing protein [Streptomyces sp. NPDC005017]|uniref:DUF6745 domain-containing protein n=1 Tax=Streptomyces sp. NPDC005017 TaxID=3364706 RepID=UPI0036981577